MLKPYSQCETFGGWWSRKVTAPMNGISTLIKGSPERFLAPFIMRMQGEGSYLSSMNQEVGPRQTRNLMAPWSWASRSVRNEFLLFISQSMVLFYSSLSRIRHWNTTMPIRLRLGYMSAFSLHPWSWAVVTDCIFPQIENIYCLAYYRKFCDPWSKMHSTKKLLPF